MQGHYADGWRVEPDADDAMAYAALSVDRLWNGYSIADLEPPFRAHARVAVAHGPAGAGAALLVLEHPAFSAITPHGDPAGVGAILDRLGALPTRSFLLARDEHLPPLARHYDLSGELHAMARMSVDRADFRPPVASQEPERLGPADLPALTALYAGYADGVFNADQFAAGPFFGVRERGALVAAGGVHVVGRRHRIAALGNVYVRPEARGRGHGEAVTAAVARALFAEGIEEVILNVAVDNAPARRIYRRLGFVDHCDYREGDVGRLDLARGAGAG